MFVLLLIISKLLIPNEKTSLKIKSGNQNP